MYTTESIVFTWINITSILFEDQLHNYYNGLCGMFTVYNGVFIAL